VLEDGKVIAVKKLHPLPGVDEEQFEKELFNNLETFQHPNIVGLVGYCFETEREVMSYEGKRVLAEKGFRALCFEYMPKGCLDKHLYGMMVLHY
jgi:interleukin-1 receptor-associated kinase 1/coatomer subunit beta'